MRLRPAATHCNILQHATVHHHTLQHTLQQRAIHGNTHCNTYCNTPQHMATHCTVSIRTAAIGTHFHMYSSWLKLYTQYNHEPYHQPQAQIQAPECPYAPQQGLQHSTKNQARTHASRVRVNNTLQHITTRRNTLQYLCNTRCNTYCNSHCTYHDAQTLALRVRVKQHTTTHCNTPPHTATHAAHNT